MKLFKYIIFSIVILNINIIVLAASDVNHGYDNYYVNKCTKDHTCMLLCAYTNKVRYTAEWAGVEAKYNYFSSYIYYDFKTQNYFVEWLSQETDLNLATHSYNIGNKYIFFEDTALNSLKQIGECPSSSFIDTSGFGVASEVCFAKNYKFCTQDSSKGNAGTNFEGESTKEYNYQTHISKYFSDWAPNVENKTCDELISGDIDIETQFTTDFSINFLYRNSIPNFINESTAYKNGLANFENKIDTLQDKCIKENEENYQNGLIDIDEYENNKQKIEDASEDLKEQLEESVDKIESGTNNPDINNNLHEFKDCTSLLGDPSYSPESGYPVTPAWYLSFAFSIIRYVAIILLIVMTIMDFVSAIASQDADILKKATNKAMKRAIICVAIFVLPTLIRFILNFVHEKATLDCIKNV